MDLPHPSFIELLFIALALAVVLVPSWKLLTRLRYPGWLALLVIIPGVNLALLYFVAFAEWPAEWKG